MQKIEQTLTSVEVAEMIGKEHYILLRDIRRYCDQINESNCVLVNESKSGLVNGYKSVLVNESKSVLVNQFKSESVKRFKIELGDFFKESSYIDAKGENRPCYRLTKKGCEFVAHKLNGVKGTVFTARYINRFHEMEEELKQRGPELPWFIKKFRGKYIILERDFSEIVGVDIRNHKLFYRPEIFRGGYDYNGWGWKCDNEQFKREYGFDYGDDPCMKYFYLSGIPKALRVLKIDSKEKLGSNADKILLEGINSVRQGVSQRVAVESKESGEKERKIEQLRICIDINYDGVGSTH